jgi:hypothetical protein
VRDAGATYATVVAHELFVEGSGWAVRDGEMRESAQATVEALRDEFVGECRSAVIEEVEAAVEGPTWEVLTLNPDDLWVQLRQIVKNGISSAVQRLDAKLTGYRCSAAHSHRFYV